MLQQKLSSSVHPNAHSNTRPAPAIARGTKTPFKCIKHKLSRLRASRVVYTERSGITFSQQNCKREGMKLLVGNWRYMAALLALRLRRRTTRKQMKFASLPLCRRNLISLSILARFLLCRCCCASLTPPPDLCQCYPSILPALLFYKQRR